MTVDVDFGCIGSSTENTARYRGMNPAFVRRVWAKRRRDEVKSKSPKLAKIIKLRPEETYPTLEIPEVLDAAQQVFQAGFSTIVEAKELVSGLYDIPADEITKKTRKARIVKARHAAICAVKLRWPEIGLLPLGEEFDVDHTTVMYALKRYGINTAQPQKHAA